MIRYFDATHRDVPRIAIVDYTPNQHDDICPAAEYAKVFPEIAAKDLPDDFADWTAAETTQVIDATVTTMVRA